MLEGNQFAGWGNDPIAMARLGSRRRRVIVAALATAGVITVISSLAEGRVYTCSASFMPLGTSGTSPLSGVAAQLGISVSGADPTNSPEFYVDLTQSGEVLGRIADAEDAKSVVGADATPRGVDLAESDRRRAAAITTLRKQVRAVADPRTGVVHLGVKDGNPQHACVIAAKLLEEVNRFNLTQRQAQFESERTFVQAQLADEALALRSAEDAVEEFLQENRKIQGSPELQFRYDRLTRQLALHQDLYGQLSRALENATLEGERNTPVITVVERPGASLRPMVAYLVQRLLMVLIGVFILSVFAVVGLEYFSKTLTNQSQNEDALPEQTPARQTVTLR
jgi:uncharacterized protein involved in exopolysaccharide biosynthesis